MRCCDRHLRRTEPAPGGSRNELVTPPPRSRRNGWSGKPESLQLISYLTYTYFVIVGFGIFIPLLPTPWDLMAYGLLGFLFIVHLVTHIASVTIDPAEPSVRARNYSTTLPTFDKNKHEHVICDLHCKICDIDVGPRAKHCKTCNKCVTDFDHHCIYLNNCVGRRNYWFFFVTALTAAIGVLLLLLIVLFIFIEHFLNAAVLRTAPQFQGLNNSTWLVFLPLAPVQTSSAGLLVVSSFTIILALVYFLVLVHLLGFHIFLLTKKVTTYEYIMKKRQARNNRDVVSGRKQSRPTSAESAKPQPSVNVSVDCESPMPSLTSQTSHSSAEYEDERKELAARLSMTICAELRHLQILSSPGPNNYYSTRASTEMMPGMRALSESLSWTGQQQVVVNGEQGNEMSTEATPVIQNPLGSSVIGTAAVEQQLSVDARSESALSKQ
ncbi:palmitoyltransferase ZDHHC11 [Alosa sapidissima]|uniref:palmitoyltransferase ZDHHC11 n=1 Tax=Alosa sapidissima TaxID=34773 RepID=UPI001C084098|nr:palmitoyltransferase ZDHHC11 [Alosa sapidissima]